MLPQFTHPAFDGATFDAVAYGEPWNGLVTPVVDRATLEAMLEVLDDYHLRGWVDGEDILHIEYLDGNGRPGMFDEVAPRADGTYDLGHLAWTFELAEERQIDDGDHLLLTTVGPDLDIGL